MKRIYKWLAWIAGVPVVGFALLVAAAFWMMRQREAKFPSLPPGERQMAIFDAFTRTVELNYYDREYIERDWPSLRDHWRGEALKARTDFDIYWTVMFQFTQRLPSSHILATPPPRPVPTPGKKSTGRESTGTAEASRAPPGESGAEIAVVRRSRSIYGVIDWVAPGSPAAAAGIEPGWLVLSSKSCDRGQQVTVVFQTNGSTQQRLDLEFGKTVTLYDPAVTTSADLEAKFRRSVTYTCVEAARRAPFEVRDIGGVTYVRFDTFKEPKLIDQALAAIERAGERGLILDLRWNSGGYRDEMLRLMSRLLPDGELVGTEITRGRSTEFRSAGATGFTRPLAVLIGPTTASAAEVTAAALQDHHRARLLGRPSAGATLTSGEFPLPDGGRVQVAFADLLRPGGQRIEASGVMPDIGIMPTLEDVRAGRDPVLERALAELAPKVVSPPTGSRPRPV